MSIERVTGGEAASPSRLGVGLLLAWAAIVYGAYALAYVAP